MAVPNHSSLLSVLFRFTSTRSGELLTPEIVPRDGPTPNGKARHPARLWTALTVAIGLALLLTSAAAAEGAPKTAAVPPSPWISTDHAGPPAGQPNTASSGLAFITYLPSVFRGYPGCTTLPVLISPADGSTLTTIAPLYVWDRGTNPAATGLRLQVATDAAFSHVVNTLGAYGNAAPEFRFASNLQPATIHYWRAQLICDNMWGPYTDVWSFASGSGGTVLPAPTLLEPANGAVTPGTSVTVKWEAVPGAVEYVLFWRKASEAYPGFEWLTATQKGSRWPENTTYVWWVAARNEYAIGAESEHWQFTTPAASPPAGIEGLRPSWLVEDGAATRVSE
jgi:hypothetical protein